MRWPSARMCWRIWALAWALLLRGAGVESYFYFYVAAMSAITLLAAVLMPDLRKHGYLDGSGCVEENTGLRSSTAYAGARG